jgi:transposase
MKYVRLAEAEEITIVEMRKYHPKSRVRERALMIELSNKGNPIDKITEIVGRNRDTVSTWLNNYEKYGITGILDNPKPGRNPKVKDPIKDRIMEIAESDHTCSSGYITEIIEEEFGVKLHPDTIKYHLKKRKICLQKNKKQPKGEKRWVKIR